MHRSDPVFAEWRPVERINNAVCKSWACFRPNPSRAPSKHSAGGIFRTQAKFHAHKSLDDSSWRARKIDNFLKKKFSFTPFLLLVLRRLRYAFRSGFCLWFPFYLYFFIHFISVSKRKNGFFFFSCSETTRGTAPLRDTDFRHFARFRTRNNIRLEVFPRSAHYYTLMHASVHYCCSIYIAPSRNASFRIIGGDDVFSNVDYAVSHSYNIVARQVNIITFRTPLYKLYSRPKSIIRIIISMYVLINRVPVKVRVTRYLSSYNNTAQFKTLAVRSQFDCLNI